MVEIWKSQGLVVRALLCSFVDTAVSEWLIFLWLRNVHWRSNR